MSATGLDMTRTFKTLAVAAFLASTASLAGAAPVTNVGDIAGKPSGNLLRVHGFHEYCARDRYGWHRHNLWGERRRCRQWRGIGPRPDFCVRVGPIWICDY
jgi:hypothetical protein